MPRYQDIELEGLEDFSEDDFIDGHVDRPRRLGRRDPVPRRAVHPAQRPDPRRDACDQGSHALGAVALARALGDEPRPDLRPNASSNRPGTKSGNEKFGKYHLTYLNKDEIHEVDVLAGAFMLVRKETLDKVGLLDETFFMYGEDIDLSYRIILGGYKNYYFPETTIIHYKGESTKKGSLNYVKVFYNAMIIFARKHFSHGKAGIFAFIIHLAIWFRAFISVLKRIFEKIALPVLDAILIFLGFCL